MINLMTGQLPDVATMKVLYAKGLLPPGIQPPIDYSHYYESDNDLLRESAEIEARYPLGLPKRL
jgi:hypothetical protein